MNRNKVIRLFSLLVLAFLIINIVNIGFCFAKARILCGGDVRFVEVAYFTSCTILCR